MQLRVGQNEGEPLYRETTLALVHGHPESIATHMNAEFVVFGTLERFGCGRPELRQGSGRSNFCRSQLSREPPVLF